LELIDKVIVVGKSLSNHLGINVDISRAQSEYLRIIASLSEPEPPSVTETLPFEQHHLPVRLFVLPMPTSMIGWIATFTYYINVLVAILLIIVVPFSMYHLLQIFRMSGATISGGDIIASVIASFMYVLVPLLIAVLARFWAIRVAKATIRRDREKFERETTPQHTPVMQKSRIRG